MHKQSRWKTAAAIVSVTVALGLTACQTGDPRSLNSTGNTTKSGFKACMIYEETLSDRRSINMAAFVGLQKAADTLPIEIAYYGQRSDTERDKSIAWMEKEGCSLTIGIGFLLANTIREAARQNPGAHFVIVDSRLHEDDSEDQPLTLPNVKPLLFDAAESSFLAGYLAGAISKTGVVGTYGGVSFAPVRNSMDGFVMGVQLYEQESHRPITILGWDPKTQHGLFVEDFYSVRVAKRITDQMIAKKADVIFPVAGAAGQGTLMAITPGSGVKMFGVDEDWAGTYPDYAQYIPTSVMKNISQAVFETIRDAQRGNYSSAPYVGNLRNGGVELAALLEFEAEIPAQVRTRIKQLSQEIISGKLRVNAQNHP